MAIHWIAMSDALASEPAAEGCGLASALHASWAITGVGPEGNTLDDHVRDALAQWAYDEAVRAGQWARIAFEAEARGTLRLSLRGR